MNSLLLRNFRNYVECSLQFHPKLNVIIGNNAQGKTNLLEAISYLSLGSSFRSQPNDKIKRWDSDFFFLRANYQNQLGSHSLSVGFQRRERIWKKDEQPCSRLSEIVGQLHTVVFSPEDLKLVQSGPDKRRAFLDREMVQLLRGYHIYLNNYKRALMQRNNLLKQMPPDLLFSSAGDEQLAIWEEQLAVNGAEIVRRRSFTLQALNEICQELHSRLTGSQEHLHLVYSSTWAEQAGKLEAEELADLLRQSYAQGRREDKQRRLTLLGPHRDDFAIYINEVDGRTFGSQGQQRTAALALKLSELELVHKLSGYYPLLLLDDVFSEFDSNRRQALLSLMLNKAQIFITCTEIANDLQKLNPADYQLFKVQAGCIK